MWPLIGTVLCGRDPHASMSTFARRGAAQQQVLLCARSITVRALGVQLSWEDEKENIIA